MAAAPWHPANVRLPKKLLLQSDRVFQGDRLRYAGPDSFCARSRKTDRLAGSAPYKITILNFGGLRLEEPQQFEE